MKKGIQTLEDIDDILHTVRNEIARIDEQIDLLFEHSQKNKEDQSKTIDALAKIYFMDIENKNVSQSQSGIGSDVHSLLEKREKVYQQLLLDIKKYNKELMLLEGERDKAHQLLDDAAKDVIKKEHEVQSVLEEDTVYQKQLEQTRELQKITTQSEEKALEAEQTRIIKGEPYEEDVLFSYLWREKYGTSEYDGTGLTKVLDSWVASLSEYEQYRVNYWTLLEIPKRLRHHANEEKKAYELELEKLSKIEHKHAENMGLNILQATEKSRQEEVDAIDDEIEKVEKELTVVLEHRQKHLEDKDDYAIEIISKINHLLVQMSLPELHKLVKQTSTKEDDKLANNLDSLKKVAIKMQNEINAHRKLYDEKIKQLHEVEALRVKFKRSRYDDIRSGFGNSRVIEDMLGGLLGGLSQSDILWDTLRRSQIHVDTGSWPDFGSGGFKSGSGSPWHFPQSRDGGSIFNLPDMGGFSSRNTLDSFSTGGGF